jgi:hypothetical protein
MPKAPKGLVFNLLSLQKKEVRLLYYNILYIGYLGVGREKYFHTPRYFYGHQWMGNGWLRNETPHKSRFTGR